MSTPTDSRPANPCTPRLQRARRGIAEIETLFSMIILMGFLFLIWGSMLVQANRVGINDVAAKNTFESATSLGVGNSVSGLLLKASTRTSYNGSVAASTRSFPNRVIVGEDEVALTLQAPRTKETPDGTFGTFHLHAQAELVEPAWTWSGAYRPLDGAPIKTWYRTTYSNAVTSDHRKKLKMSSK